MELILSVLCVVYVAYIYYRIRDIVRRSKPYKCPENIGAYIRAQEIANEGTVNLIYTLGSAEESVLGKYFARHEV